MQVDCKSQKKTSTGEAFYLYQTFLLDTWPLNEVVFYLQTPHWALSTESELSMNLALSERNFNEKLIE